MAVNVKVAYFAITEEVFIDRQREIPYAHHLLTSCYFHFVFDVLTVFHGVWILDELLIRIKVKQTMILA